MDQRRFQCLRRANLWWPPIIRPQVNGLIRPSSTNWPARSSRTWKMDLFLTRAKYPKLRIHHLKCVKSKSESKLPTIYQTKDLFCRPKLWILSKICHLLVKLHKKFVKQMTKRGLCRQDWPFWSVKNKRLTDMWTFWISRRPNRIRLGPKSLKIYKC